MFFKALQRLRHPNIVRLYGTAKDDTHDILLLEHVSEGALSSHFRSEVLRGNMSSVTRVNILCEVARALHFLHNGGVIDESKQKYKMLHRDIKSSNICLDSNYNAKLIDCGLAKFDVVMGSGVANNISVATGLYNTTTHQIMGTCGYMCPRYREGYIKEYQAACDVYSFGVVMFEMITGSVQNENGDLVLMYKTPQTLALHADPLAGFGWNHIICQLTELALQCVEFDMTFRPTFGQISKRLSLMQMRMTGFVDTDPDADPEANAGFNGEVTCSICSNSCSESHSIVCRHGHIMDSECCKLKVLNFISRPQCTDEFRCPHCTDRIGLAKLVNKIPFEYVNLLQQVRPILNSHCA